MPSTATCWNNRKPEYPGGIELFYKFVVENFKISDEAYENKLKGKVYVTFIIEKTAR
jgi:hypothetical protein